MLFNKHKFILFDEDATGDQGGGASSEESQGEEGEGLEGGGENPWAGIEPFLTEDGNLRVKRNGQEVELGPQEVIDELQKGLSGDQRLQEAAKQQSKVQFADDFDDAMSGSENAYFRLAAARGMNKAEASELLQYFEDGGSDEMDDYNEDEEGYEEDYEGGDDEGNEEPAIQYVEREPTAEERETQEWARQRQLEEIREAIHGDLDEGLDNDPRFDKMMRQGGKRADQIRQLARNAVKRIVVSESVAYDSSVRGRVLDELGHTLDTFGPQGSSIAIPGAGPAPLGGAPELTVRSSRPSKRPDPSSPDYENWVIGQMAAFQEEALLSDS